MRKFFQTFKCFDFIPHIDIFASRMNKRLHRFYSFRPNPKPESINAFAVDWCMFKFCCFPWFSCIGRVLEKIIADKAAGMMVVPGCINQYWFIMLQDLFIKKSSVIPPSEDQLILPNQPLTRHSLSRNFEMLACLVLEKKLGEAQTFIRYSQFHDEVVGCVYLKTKYFLAEPLVWILSQASGWSLECNHK